MNQYPGLTLAEYKAIIAVEGMTLTPEAEARLQLAEDDERRDFNEEELAMPRPEAKVAWHKRKFKESKSNG